MEVELCIISFMSISALEKWYLARCNGDWEHQFGVKIDTLDNPGWTMRIDLQGTPAESRDLEWQKIERSEHDWIAYRVKNAQFEAAMGPTNLGEGIQLFLDWFEQTTC